MRRAGISHAYVGALTRFGMYLPLPWVLSRRLSRRCPSLHADPAFSMPVEPLYFFPPALQSMNNA